VPRYFKFKRRKVRGHEEGAPRSLSARPSRIELLLLEGILDLSMPANFAMQKQLHGTRSLPAISHIGACGNGIVVLYASITRPAR
jgi:hypothetical protein